VRAGQSAAALRADWATEGALDPTCPRQVLPRVESMQQLHLETLILDGKRADPKAPLLLASTNRFPSHQAFCTGGFFRCVPEESTPKGVDGADQSGWEWHGAHSIDWEGIQDGVQQDNAPPLRRAAALATQTGIYQFSQSEG
jgi:hypothetical protein